MIIHAPAGGFLGGAILERAAGGGPAGMALGALVVGILALCAVLVLVPAWRARP